MIFETQLKTTWQKVYKNSLKRDTFHLSNIWIDTIICNRYNNAIAIIIIA